jgi:hypothetical protein
MDANDRKGVLRRLIETELKPLESVLRWQLREPIEEGEPPAEQPAPDGHGFALHGHAGRSWGP